MPYLYEVDSILSQLFHNGTINSIDFPNFFGDIAWEMRSALSEAKGFDFFKIISLLFFVESGNPDKRIL